VSDLIPLAPAHLEVAAEIHHRCFPEAWDAAQLGLLLRMPGCFGVMAAPPDGFVLARVAADEAEIITIAVLPAARRSGLGGRLLDAACAAAAQAGAAALFLEVASDNCAAIALYHGRQFQAVGRRANYYGRNRDAIVLRRDLI
jgi:ribosomal-protein-alanine N-acetyltransferase